MLAFFTPVVGWCVRKARKAEGRFWDYWWLPAGAGFAWFWAVQLPNIPITSASDTTTMHFLGGAVVGPLLYAYIVRAGRFRLPSSMAGRALLFYGAAFLLFGGGNEILELMLVKLLLFKIDLSDTGWDLAMDFVGCTTAFIAIELYNLRQTRSAALATSNTDK
jgi:hypothetical protein